MIFFKIIVSGIKLGDWPSNGPVERLQLEHCEKGKSYRLRTEGFPMNNMGVDCRRGWGVEGRSQTLSTELPDSVKRASQGFIQDSQRRTYQQTASPPLLSLALAN